MGFYVGALLEKPFDESKTEVEDIILESFSTRCKDICSSIDKGKPVSIEFYLGEEDDPELPEDCIHAFFTEEQAKVFGETGTVTTDASIYKSLNLKDSDVTIGNLFKLDENGYQHKLLIASGKVKCGEESFLFTANIVVGDDGKEYLNSIFFDSMQDDAEGVLDTTFVYCIPQE